ncbi:uncharacterized protein EI97DRAFT_292454 [Westerdykella ornata]|uniref:Symplekin/Pta1 N-terminal domain-containing protein n=1 Tax=Westerdykella ornata TaxID=318751 RepID=A0A6A6JLJ3_WESOR|nr:uncharacterized protein EI97DRAFT_292454 [Westerdykella ornata]KAF2277461.1 hypothetical protein EI97DRAFT_292454 [Westerdykella ornata]
MGSSSQSLAQLEAARGLALGDGRYYPTIIPGVLPIIGVNANATLEVQRWGADFLAETFASPTWAPDVKASSALTVLPTLHEFVEATDASIVKSAIQAAACIYPLVYRHIISDPNDKQSWQIMSTIKSSILRRMDSAIPGVRICCVKFVQQVVLVQTPGQTADPRRQDPNDISLSHVPRDHPLIPYANLEAEASGLLDRLLDTLHSDYSDALLVTATLNTLGALIQRRPVIANKILNSVLNFNPLKLANSPMTPKNKVLIRSLERTTRALLVNVLKRNPESSVNVRIQQYLERMHRMRVDAFDEASRKRPAPVEPTDGLDTAKRQRLGATLPPTKEPTYPPLPPGPVSYRQLYTLDPTASTANFDVQIFQDRDQLVRILVSVLHSIDETKLNNAVNAVRARYNTYLQDASRHAAPPNITAAVDEEEEYEPDFEPEDAEQVINRLDSVGPDEIARRALPEATIAPYKLPDAPPLTEQEVQRYGEETIRRAFSMLSAMEEPPAKTKVPKGGFNRLAASNFDRDSWITIMSRLATRAPSGLDDPEEGIKAEYGRIAKRGSFALAEAIRDGLYNYIMYDWKRRLDLAISWLNEEWYNDRLHAEAAEKNFRSVSNGKGSSRPDIRGNYKKCALRLLDGLVAYIEGTDKVLVRFMSEIPEIDREILQRMKRMAEDPERIELAILVLQYLYMFRPPVRSICVDVLEDMWRTNDRAKPSARKFLIKWRPEVLQSENEVKMESTNGTLEVKPVS